MKIPVKVSITSANHGPRLKSIDESLYEFEDTSFQWFTRSLTPTPSFNTDIPRVSLKSLKETHEKLPKNYNKRFIYKPKIIYTTPRSFYRIYQIDESNKKETNKLQQLKKRFSPDKKTLNTIKHKYIKSLNKKPSDLTKN